MKISIISKTDLAKFISLCGKDAGVFGSEDWLRIYGDTVKICGITNDDGRPEGYFYLYEQKRKGMRFLVNAPYTPNNALCFINRAENKANRNSRNKELMTMLAQFISGISCTGVSLAFPVCFTDMQPFVWKKFKVVPNYTYHFDLSQTENELLANMSPERRNSISKCVKDGVVLSLCKNRKLVKEMVMKMNVRKKNNMYEGILDKILFEFANVENSFAYEAIVDGKVIATSFCVMDEHTVYYLLGGYDEHNKHNGAGAAVLWESIRHAKRTGRKIFDTEGSMLPEVEKFFRSFGGALVPYFTINKAKMPVEFLLKPIMREKF